MLLAYRIVLAQGVASLVGALLCTALAVFWPLTGASGLSGLLGGLVITLPNALFAWRAEKQRDAQRVLVLGAMKLVLTITLMVIVFAAYRPEPWSFFGVLALAYVAVAVAVGVETKHSASS